MKRFSFLKLAPHPFERLSQMCLKSAHPEFVEGLRAESTAEFGAFRQTQRERAQAFYLLQHALWQERHLSRFLRSAPFAHPVRQVRVGASYLRQKGRSFASIVSLTATGILCTLGASASLAQTADTQAPTVPGALTVTAATSTSVRLSWAASTDDVAVTAYLVERCQGAGCANFAQATSTTALTYNNTGRTVLTSYSYRVRARDAANNRSAYSNVVTVVTPDTTVPIRPATLTPTVISSSQINLTWAASTDNVGVTQYRIERCTGTSCTNYAQIATSTTTAFSNTVLAANTTYRYRVRANDAAGNLSTYSPIGTAKTLVLDTVPPTAPSALTTSVISTTQINLSWTASTDNVAVTNYLIERCQGAGCLVFTQVATSAAATYNDTGRLAGTTYRYRVRATDATNNLSGYSSIQSAATTSGVVDCD